MNGLNLRKLSSALALGAALVVPTLLPADASAQRGRDRHDNGNHNGWDRGRGNPHRDDRRDWDQRRDWDRRRDDRRRDDRRNDWRGRNDDHRQSTKNQWRNLGYLGGAVGIAGLLTHNKTMTYLGLGGGLYSLYRYDQDRKSQNRDDRYRYELFNRSSFDHGGHHYERRTRNQGGQKYYYFTRTR